MPSAADPPVIQAEHLAVGYGETVVLESLDFTVSRGDVFAILGGSGSGKSTLLRTLIGLQEPLHGSVRISGAHPPRGGAPTYGVLFQSGALFGSMPLAQNVALALAKWTNLDPRTSCGASSPSCDTASWSTARRAASSHAESPPRCATGATIRRCGRSSTPARGLREMATTATNHWKLGLFVVLGVGVMLGALFWLGARRFRRESFAAVSYFDE